MLSLKYKSSFIGFNISKNSDLKLSEFFQEVENDRSLFVKRQKEYVQHQFEWFKTDLKDGWRKEAEKKHEEFCDHVQQAISQQLREFQKYVLHAQQSDLQLFKTQIISKLEVSSSSYCFWDTVSILLTASPPAN